MSGRGALDSRARAAARPGARIVERYRDLVPALEVARGRGLRIALTNGCFDLLHVGHVRLLREAAELGDLLVVALNGDASARAIKGPERPLVPLAERMELLAAVAGVDFVTSFEELTAHALLEALRPELYVKGRDRRLEEIPERAVVETYGGRVLLAGDAKQHSSSALAERLRGDRGR